MLILIHKLQAYILSNTFVIGKVRFMEFQQTPPTNYFDDSRIPISMHICKNMHYRVSIDNKWPFGNLLLPKKVIRRNSRVPLSEDKG